MRALLFVVIVVILAVLLGWITMTRSGDRTAINIETDVIKADTSRAGEHIERAADRAVDQGKKAVDEVRHTEVDVDVRRRPPEERTE